MRNRFCFLAAALLLCLLFASCAGGAQSARTPSPDPPDVSAAVPPSLSPSSAGPSASSADSAASGPSSEESEPRLSCRVDGDGGIVACWWWSAEKAVGRVSREKYLDFLSANGVNAVYLCLPDFTREQMAAFVRAAGARGISVSLLTGDIAFFDRKNDLADRVIASYLSYQQSAAEEERLAAIHFDVEPHQRPDFAQNRDEILQLYADFTARAYAALHAAGERVEWDIPFWFDDFSVSGPDNTPRPLLEWLADCADTLCVMAYRDRAADAFALCEKEIEICRARGLAFVCGVDAFSEEAGNVSFAEEGKRTMYREINGLYRRLKNAFRDASFDASFGVAIHYLDTWYSLKIDP